MRARTSARSQVLFALASLAASVVLIDGCVSSLPSTSDAESKDATADGSNPSPDSSPSTDEGGAVDSAASPEASTPDATGSSDDSGAEAGEDAAADAHVDAAPQDAGSDALTCGANQKVCSGACVTEAAGNGCASTSCAACSVANGAATCTSGACAVGSCTAPYKDCDGKESNGCEVDTNTDAANCGTCGHSCGGGACSGGVCQPWALASGRPSSPLNLALDPNDKYLFWTENGSGGVYQIPVGGGTVTTIKAPDTSSGSWAVATDGTNVYWSDRANGTIGGNNVTGSSTQWSYASPNGSGASTYGITILGSTLYAADFGSGYVWHVAASSHGSTGTNYLTASAPTGLFGYSGNLVTVLYNGSNGGATAGNLVYLNGSAAAAGTPNVDSRYVTTDGTNIYWTASDGNSVWMTPFADSTSAPTALSTSESQPWGIATDGTNSVYWVNYSNGTIRHATYASNAWTIATIATGNVPTDIRVDATAIYWADYGGSRIMRVNK